MSASLTAQGCRARQSRLWDAVAASVDLIAITEPVHINYLCGFYPSPFSFGTAGGSAILWLSRARGAVLVTDNILEQYALDGALDEVVAPVWYDCSEEAPRRRALIVKAAAECLARWQPSGVGYEPSTAPAALIDGIQAPLTDIEPALLTMRRRKDDDEVAVMRRAMRAGARALDTIRRETTPGTTELEIYGTLHRVAREDAGEAVLMYGDILSGPRCLQVGGFATERQVEVGDPVLIDLSVILAGYRCDIANTFRCGAAPTDTQRLFHGLCLTAMAAAEAALVAGGSAADVDAAARGTFERERVAEHFPHHSGHGIGLTHPEAPFFLPGSNDVLEPGNVVTVEPGLYAHESGGMRFERNYLVTEGAPEVLTPHQLEMAQDA